MNLFLSPLLGFSIAFISVVPPGLINMTAAKISTQEGKGMALSFAIGASAIIFIQTFIAILFSRLISNNVQFVSILQEIAIFVFLVLSCYFFYFAKKPKKIKASPKVKGKSNRFFLGVFLSALNILPIPFYVFLSMSLAASGYLDFDKISIFTFVLGVVCGSFAVFYLYIVAFKKIERRADFILRNINNIIGSVTALMALFTLIKLIYK